MSDSISKITNILLVIMIALTAVFAILFYIDIAGVAEDENLPTTWINNFLKYSYVLGIISGAAAIFFAVGSFVMKFIDSPKKGLLSLLPIILLVVVLFVAYSYASDAKLNMPNYDGPDNVANVLKWSGTGLILTYVLFGLAVISVIYVEVAKLFK